MGRGRWGLLLILLGLIAVSSVHAQIRLGVPGSALDGSATVDINAGPFASGSPYRGLLVPRVNTTQRNQILNPAVGLLIFNTSTNQIEVNTGSTTSPVWTPGGGATGVTGGSWNLTGNAGTSSGNFLGTTDNSPLYFRVNNQNSGIINQYLNNVAFGYVTLNTATTGQGNTALGAYTLSNNTSGNYNTAVGLQALTGNTTGTGNAAFGTIALLANTTGQFNTASGYKALTANTTGTGNTALGAVTLQANTSGNNNTAVGQVALSGNVDGVNNTAVGAGALQSNTSGYENTAIGTNAEKATTTGHSNIALGTDALYNNTIGNDNTAFGASALIANTNGSSNMASGNLALSTNTTGQGNTAAGTNALRFNTTGSTNTAVGFDAGPPSGSGTLTNTTAIGANAKVSTSNTIVLGDNSITSLRCNVQTISTLSDKRIKENIKTDVPGLSFINRLTPVTYYVNKHKEAQLVGNKLTTIREDTIRHSGFLAQDVEAAAKTVGYEFEGVRREEGGKYYTVGYSLFVVPLVQAVKDLNAEVKQLKAKVQADEMAYAQLAAQVKQLQNIVKGSISEQAAQKIKHQVLAEPRPSRLRAGGKLAISRKEDRKVNF